MVSQLPIGVVLPVRSFAGGLTRLANRLSQEERATFARAWATNAIHAAQPHPMVVVTNDSEVATWARSHALDVIADPGSLNDAAHAGHQHWQVHNATRTVIVHADLPRLRSIAALTAYGSRPIASLVPCHRNDGTPALSIPTGADFVFAYGPGSFRAHLDAARAAGLAPHIVRAAELRFDIDVPSDLDALEMLAVGSDHA